jgi:hypothetical protein
MKRSTADLSSGHLQRTCFYFLCFISYRLQKQSSTDQVETILKKKKRFVEQLFIIDLEDRAKKN